MSDLLCHLLLRPWPQRGSLYSRERFPSWPVCIAHSTVQFLPGMPRWGCPMPPASGRALCFSVTASQPLFASGTGQQLVFTDQEENVFWRQGPCPPVPPNCLFCRETPWAWAPKPAGGGRCKGPAQWQRQSLRNPLWVIWNSLDDRCIMCAFHMVQRSHRRELSGTIKIRVGLLWRDLIAKIWPYKTDNPGVIIPFTPTPFPSLSDPP